MCRKYWCIDAGRTPNEFVPIEGVNPQSAQIRCRVYNCIFNKNNRCENISPALDLSIDCTGQDTFTCYSEKHN